MRFNNIVDLADKMAERSKEGLSLHIVDIAPFTLIYLTDDKGIIHNTSLATKDFEGFYYLIESEKVEIGAFLIFEALNELYDAVKEYDPTLLVKKDDDDVFNLEI